MQKVVNVLSLISFGISACLFGAVLYTLSNAQSIKSRMAQQIQAEVLVLVMDATAKHMRGMMPIETGPAMPFGGT
jgi:cell division protein FtsX